MKKINLEEFNENFGIVLAYCLNHIIHEDWCEYDGNPLVADIFDTMQHFVVATKKCVEYGEILKDYEKADKKGRGCVFLDA